MSKSSFRLIIILNICFLIISFYLSVLNFNNFYDINYLIIAMASSISLLIPILSIFGICYSCNIDILNSICGFKLKKEDLIVNKNIFWYNIYFLIGNDFNFLNKNNHLINW